MIYLKHFSLKKPPFENTPDPAFFYYSEEHKEAITRLKYVVSTKKPLCLITGEYGSGKTLLAYKIQEELPQKNFHIVYSGNPFLPSDEIIHHLILLLGGTNNKLSLKKVEMLQLFCEILKRNVQIGRHTVIIIDEAHLIEDIKTFEELRVLLNYVVDNNFALTIILLGQTELREKLSSLPQFKQRVNYHYHLQNLDLKEVGSYIKHRLLVSGHPDGEIFLDSAVKKIFEITDGLPRSINNLCDVCLMIGFEKGVDKINDEVVEEAKKEVFM